MLLRCLSHRFSLYQGISPSLLASISMSSALNATSQSQLISQLVHRNILYPGHLQSISRSIDRSWFTKSPTPYNDIPTPISKKQMMTSPLVQLLSLRYIEENIAEVIGKNGKEEVRVLDIGCGHGYVALLLHQLVKKMLKERRCETHGIDIWKQCVEAANKVKEDKFAEIKDEIKFQEGNIEKYNQGNYDIIYCGFYVKDSLHEQLVEKLKDNALGIWPISDEGQQKLYFWKKVDGKLKREFIMASLFSAQKNIVDQKIQKYFVEFNKDAVEENAIEEKVEVKEEVKKEKKSCDEEKSEIKKWQAEFKTKNGRVPTLLEMRQDQRINKLLDYIRKNS